MYNHQLDTFIAVANAGSFNKAAKALYISPNAIMKQIDILERNIGFPLFERSHTGLKLTKAGESFYRDAKYLIQYSKEAIQRAKQLKTNHTIKVGVSFTTPADYLLELYNLYKKELEPIQLDLVSFENNPNNAQEIMKNFGQTIDLVTGIYSDNLLEMRNCLAYKLYDTPLAIAMPKTHPLTSKKELIMDDLRGETLLILKRNYLTDFDRIRLDLMNHYPQIQIEDIEFFNIHAFNQCVNKNKLMLVVPEWKNIHPLLTITPVKWDYTIPFGILYSTHPSKEVQRLLKVLSINLKVNTHV